MEVIIRWDQRAHGREIGEVEQVEKTEFVSAIIEQGRVTMLEEVVPVIEDDEVPDALVAVVQADPKPKPKPRKVAESKDEDGGVQTERD